MIYRQLGRSGLRVSALGIGTMTYGGGGVFAKTGTGGVEDARRQIGMCLDAGINLIDTANIYSTGRSEEIVGEALEGQRERVVLATKVRFPMGSGPNDAGLSRYHIIAECEASLRRLRTDRIDLYQVHQWDGLTPLEETLEALDTLVRQGKVRYLGCSNYSAWHLMKALYTSERLGAQRFISQQIHYSLQAREAEYELVPVAIDQDVGILVWSPLAGGLLTGKYRRNHANPGQGRQLEGWDEPPVRDREKLFDIVEVLVEIAETRAATASQVALAWLIGRPGVSSAIFGARTDAQLEANLEALHVELADDERRRLDEVSAPPLLYPYWHQAKTASDRLSDADMTLLGNYI